MSGKSIVSIGDKEWLMDVATLPWELSQGLGGLTELPPATGMIFDLGYEQIIEVTTVPMLFSLDIAFLSEELVITEVYRDVKPDYLVLSQIPARYFMEVNTGELEGIAPGDQADMDLLPLEEIPVMPDPVSIMYGLAGLLLLGTFAVSIAREEINDPQKDHEFLPHVSLEPSENSYVLQSDRMGNIIITRTDEPGKDVFLQFESDKELIYDLLKKEEKKDLYAGWEVRVKRTEPRASILDGLWENSASGQTMPATLKKPTRLDVTIDTWQERDRLGIWITDKRTDMVIARWWDDEAREMFLDGFFKPGVPQHATDKPSREFIDSVLDYAESVEILAASGPPAVILQQRQSLVSKDSLDFLPDSPEYLAYTIDDIGYREKIDSAFLSAIARSRGKTS